MGATSQSSPSDELKYLKSLVEQLNEKIKTLETKAKNVVSPTPAQQLRMILVGPPGAGACFLLISTSPLILILS